MPTDSLVVAVDDQTAVRRDRREPSPTRSRVPASWPPSSSARALRRRLAAGGTTGNEQLTAATGIVLLVLLAALGVTILRVRLLLSEHMFLGILLIPPVALKMASTGYRFVRYYTSNPRYRRKGAPPPTLRLIAPIVVASTVVVFASGVALLLLGPSSRGSLLLIHKASFVIWIAVTSIHVLAHLSDLPRALKTKHAIQPRLESYGDGRAGRILSLSGALVAGLVLAILYIPQFGPWLHAHH
jgi:hypothetical protein